MLTFTLINPCSLRLLLEFTYFICNMKGCMQFVLVVVSMATRRLIVWRKVYPKVLVKCKVPPRIWVLNVEAVTTND